MAKFQFQGDIGLISAKQLEFVESVLKDRGYKNEKVLIEPVGKAGDNYLANVKRIVVEKDGGKFQMVAKFAPTIEYARSMANTVVVFRNEHVMYTEVLPKFSELEKSAGVPNNERLRYATCYGSFTEAPNEVILLEDLQVSDFVMLDRFKTLTDENVKLVLKSFARIHSLSYALKNQEPETYSAFSSKLINMWAIMNNVPEVSFYFTQLESDILTLLNGRSKKLITGKVTQLAKLSAKRSSIDKESKYSVIQQGDAWTNNIMFRLENEKTVECCMIDYQISKESSPVADVQYMIFNCTDYETRTKHYHDWIEYYHTELDNCLANFNLKANYVYPRDQLDADLRSNAKLTIGLSLLLARTLSTESEEAAKMKDIIDNSELSMEQAIDSVKMSNMNKETITKYKNRIEGLVNSFFELGYL